MEKDPFIRELVKQQAIVQKNRDVMNRLSLKYRNSAIAGLTRAIVRASNDTEERHEKELKIMREAEMNAPKKMRKLNLKKPEPPAPAPPPPPAPAPFSEANIEARGSAFRVRIYKDGQRVIKSFKTIAEAKAWRDANK